MTARRAGTRNGGAPRTADFGRHVERDSGIKSAFLEVSDTDGSPSSYGVLTDASCRASPSDDATVLVLAPRFGT